MKKSLMSDEQLKKYSLLAKEFQSIGWSQPEHPNDFESDFHMIYELTSHRRLKNVLLRIQISFENSYLSFQISQFPVRNSEFFVSFNKEYTAIEYLMNFLGSFKEEITHDDLLEIIEKLIKKFPNNVSFFADDEEIPLNLENFHEIVFTDPANRP
jgi:hypothetical protein